MLKKIKLNNYKEQYNKKYLFYYTAIFILFVILSVIEYFSVKAYSKNKEQEHINLLSSVFFNQISSDFEIIFNKSNNLDNLYLFDNYKEANNVLLSKSNLVGTILEIPRNNTLLKVDISILNYLLQKSFNNNFFYRLLINDYLISSNTEKIKFLTTKSFYIGKNIISLDLLPKKDTAFVQKVNEEFRLIIVISLMVNILLFFLAIFVLSRFCKIITKNKILKYNIKIFQNKVSGDIEYFVSCFNTSMNNNPILQNIIPLKINMVENNSIDLSEIVELVKNNVFFYAKRFNYRVDLKLEYELEGIELNIDKILFIQLVMSLLINILYFMRSGDSIKSLSISILKDKMILQYDSFAANENHMKNWSRDIFTNTGNIYIMDCELIFKQINLFGYEYKIIPKQGANKIIISYDKTNQNKGDNIIEFTKQVSKHNNN